MILNDHATLNNLGITDTVFYLFITNLALIKVETSNL